MISTGDTAFVLTQHSSHSDLAAASWRRLPGFPRLASSTPRVAAHPTLASATAYAHGLKG